MHALHFTQDKQRELARQRYVLAHQLGVRLCLAALGLLACVPDCTCPQPWCMQTLSEESRAACDTQVELSAIMAQLQANTDMARCALPSLYDGSAPCSLLLTAGRQYWRLASVLKALS